MRRSHWVAVLVLAIGFGTVLVVLAFGPNPEVICSTMSPQGQTFHDLVGGGETDGLTATLCDPPSDATFIVAAVCLLFGVVGTLQIARKSREG